MRKVKKGKWNAIRPMNRDKRKLKKTAQAISNRLHQAKWRERHGEAAAALKRASAALSRARKRYEMLRDAFNAQKKAKGQEPDSQA